ncbi:MAG: DUF1679 domain-containing protein [Crocinitomicaceae bacterium]
MLKALKDRIIEATGASNIGEVELVQSLWSGFGAIERVHLWGSEYASIIIKRIAPPTKMNHPRGWNSNVSAERKIKSYKIERYWYENYVPNLPASVKVPNILFADTSEDQTVLVLEDLNALGYDLSYDHQNEEHFNACLLWLAHFHAFHLNQSANELWKVGTYWHLDTRQEEFERMELGALKQNAAAIDQKLNACKYQTIVHGDAKPANFCVNTHGQVAAIDFQYVGKGCGMKDVIYLMSSALTEEKLEKNHTDILDRYFLFFESALRDYDKNDVDFQKLREEWECLYSFAWADFVRFLKGWSPKHPRLTSFSTQMSEVALKCL